MLPPPVQRVIIVASKLLAAWFTLGKTVLQPHRYPVCPLLPVALSRLCRELATAAVSRIFYLVSSGNNGATFDVLYILSITSATVGSIAKYSLLNGAWTANGTYATSFGGFWPCRKKQWKRGLLIRHHRHRRKRQPTALSRLTDAAGFNTAINITTAANITLYTTPAGTSLKGVAFAPVPSANNLSVSFSPYSSSAAIQPPAISSIAKRCYRSVGKCRCFR